MQQASKLWVVVAALAVMAGCQTVAERSEESPLYPVPTGSLLSLERTVVIPGGRASIYIQQGEIKSYGQVRKYYPHCRLEMWSLRRQPRRIEPDVFTVRRVERDWRIVGREARLRQVGLTAGGNEGVPLVQINSTEMYLRSERQPDVYRLTCEQWAESFEARHLTVREIRSALGDLFTLRLAEGGTS